MVVGRIVNIFLPLYSAVRQPLVPPQCRKIAFTTKLLLQHCTEQVPMRKVCLTSTVLLLPGCLFICFNILTYSTYYRFHVCGVDSETVLVGFATTDTCKIQCSTCSLLQCFIALSVTTSVIMFYCFMG